MAKNNQTIKNSTKIKFSYFPVLITFIGFLTLGALGKAASDEHIYWIPFVANIFVYGYMLWKNVKEFKNFKTGDDHK